MEFRKQVKSDRKINCSLFVIDVQRVTGDRSRLSDFHVGLKSYEFSVEQEVLENRKGRKILTNIIYICLKTLFMFRPKKNFALGNVNFNMEYKKISLS